MSLLNLKFTSEAVEVLEQKHDDKPILVILMESTSTIKTIVEFVQCGRGWIEKADAYKIIDDALAKGDIDTSDLLEEIVETFEKNGFFSKKKVEKAIQAQLELENSEKEKKVKKVK